MSLRITKICANGDNWLLVTMKGYNPQSVYPTQTGAKTASVDAVLKILNTPVMVTIPENKVNKKIRHTPLLYKSNTVGFGLVISKEILAN